MSLRQFGFSLQTRWRVLNESSSLLAFSESLPSTKFDKPFEWQLWKFEKKSKTKVFYSRSLYVSRNPSSPNYLPKLLVQKWQRCWKPSQKSNFSKLSNKFFIYPHMWTSVWITVINRLATILYGIFSKTFPTELQLVQFISFNWRKTRRTTHRRITLYR